MLEAVGARIVLVETRLRMMIEGLLLGAGLGEAAGSVFHVDWWLLIAVAVMNGRRRVSCLHRRPVPKTDGAGGAEWIRPFMLETSMLSDLS